ncbi:hypothetical protein OsI_38488 [Oryza sativa Indica Group]|uniref:Uncharacterized protein n=1 Tax=Oryza sativa subsp. indica TaxID=39946 RepID=B8BM44_ORYSI|nr:hypothetical protein OsI_38488 [Oryza sativa Indica Group]
MEMMSLEEEETMASPTTSSCGTCKCGANDDKAKKTKTKKCELVGYEELPEWLKDNEFIHGYYRCEWPMKETILSIFSIHNETLNVWTHLIGFLLFLCLAIFTAMVIPSGDNLHSNSSRSRSNATAMDYYYIHGDLMVMSNMTRVLRHEALAAAACLLLHDPADLSQHEQIPTSCPTNTSSYYSSFSHLHNVHQQRQHAIRDAGEVTAATAAVITEPITRWPVFAYLGGAMACLLASTACHLLLCHSERANYVTLRLDYAGIAALIVASFLPIVHYSFLCDPWLRYAYTAAIACAGAATVTASLVPAFQSPGLRPLRAALFSGAGRVGRRPRRAQAGALRRRGAGGGDVGAVRGRHGRALRARRCRVRRACARAVVPRAVRPRRAQPPAVPPPRRRRRLCPLPRCPRVPQVAGRRQMLTSSRHDAESVCATTVKWIHFTKENENFN